MKIINITNLTFGKLFVLDGSKGERALVKCECGVEKLVRKVLLNNGTIKSCGCDRANSIAGRMLKPNGAAAFRNRMSHYIDNAKKRNLSFELSLEQFTELIKQPCFYCDRKDSNAIQLNNKTGPKEIRFNGIDRLDSNIGYVIDNCVPCCKYCNFAKNSSSFDEFIAMCKRIASKF